MWEPPPAAARRTPDAPAILPDAEYESREGLTALWEQIRLLPGNQRAALLLNLRDVYGNNAMILPILLGLTSHDEAARLVGLTPERLTQIWPDLPLGDNAIAAMLGLSRQQVINLRKSARERLVRRLRGGPDRTRELRNARA